MIYALTGKPMVEILERIVSKELEAIQRRNAIKREMDASIKSYSKPPRKSKDIRKVSDQ